MSKEKDGMDVSVAVVAHRTDRPRDVRQ